MSEINEAIALYLGYGVEKFPVENEERILVAYGESGLKIVHAVKAIMLDLSEIRLDWSAHSLESGTAWAVNRMAMKYPQLDSRGLSALAWAFSWWWR